MNPNLPPIKPNLRRNITMAERRTLKDFAFAIIRELLGGKTEDQAPASEAELSSASLEDIKLDDLQREKVRLDQEERKMLARLRELESKKRQLFEEGVGKPSEREQRVIARRIKELDVRAGNMDRMLQAISKQMRILNGMIQVKERTRVMAETGISKLLTDIDLHDLIIYIDKASVDGEFHMNKFDELLGILEEADTLAPELSEDQDVLEIMRAMQEAREAADSPKALEERYAEFSRQQDERQKSKELESFEEDL
jgi:hypothetical protein